MDKHEARRRVKVGAKFLDDIHPGWYGAISIELLDLQHNHYCVLGQLYGSYTNASLHLDFGDTTGVKKGFSVYNAAYGGKRDDLDLLTKAWKRKIKKLRAKERDLQLVES